MRLTPPIDPHEPVKRIRHAVSSLSRPCREPHHPCTGARGATSHWMSLTVHPAEAQVSVWRSTRRARTALSTRWPSSLTSCGLWKLPEPWTHRTRPPLLGKRTERVSHSYHRLCSLCPIAMKFNNRKWYKVTKFLFMRKAVSRPKAGFVPSRLREGVIADHIFAGT